MTREQQHSTIGHNTTGGDAAGHKTRETLRRESLSALLDGELTEFELRSLLQDREADDELLAVWERYSLAKTVLQGEPFQRTSPGFSQRVAAALESEQPHAAPARGKLDTVRKVSFAWWPATAKLAVAASVTLAVFLGMQLSLDRGESRQLVDFDSAGDMESVPEPGMVDPDAQQRLNEYIQSVSISPRSESLPDYNILRDSPLIRPVSDRELISTDLLSPETTSPDSRD